MTELSLNKPIPNITLSNQLDLLFEIYKLRIVRKKLTSKLEFFEKSLKSGHVANNGYKFKALKSVITENSNRLKTLVANVKPDCNLFDFTKNLIEYGIYIENLVKERKKRNIDLETFELTKGHYLQKILDTQENLKQLKVNATDYYDELRNDLIRFEDQRIRLTTEKLKKKITKDEFKEKSREIENLKQEVEDKLAFLKVEILDYKFD